jgi:glycosyltransferase involved in cell wall biosynthesis
MKKELLSYYPSASSKVSVIPTWVNLNVYQPLTKNENWFTDKYKLNDKFVVLYSGNQGRCHDLRTLIDSASMVNHTEYIHFVLIGDGAQNNEIRALSSAYKLTNLTFLPYQERSDLPIILSSAHVAVVSIKEDASSLVAPCKLYPHLASGTPIAAIAPSSSELSAIVTKHQLGKSFVNGASFQLSQWLAELATDPYTLKQLSSNCISYAKKYHDIDKIQAHYSHLFTSLLAP